MVTFNPSSWCSARSASKKPAPAPSRRGRVDAQSMAKQQREISVSEFFTKNRHLLGFDSPTKALLTTIKEAVDNSLDACEEAELLPELAGSFERSTIESCAQLGANCTELISYRTELCLELTPRAGIIVSRFSCTLFVLQLPLGCLLLLALELELEVCLNLVQPCPFFSYFSIPLVHLNLVYNG